MINDCGQTVRAENREARVGLLPEFHAFTLLLPSAHPGRSFWGPEVGGGRPQKEEKPEENRILAMK